MRAKAKQVAPGGRAHGGSPPGPRRSPLPKKSGKVASPATDPSRQICALRGSDQSSPRRFRNAGTVPGRAAADSPDLRPLHSLPHSASPTTRDALAHFDGHKLPRQPWEKSARGKKCWPAKSQCGEDLTRLANRQARSATFLLGWSP